MDPEIINAITPAKLIIDGISPLLKKYFTFDNTF